MLSVTHYVLLFSVALATVFDGVVASYPPINDQDETINFLGRTFVINEKPTLSSQSTPAQIFRQCMDHTKSNGCDTKWDQVKQYTEISTNSFFAKYCCLRCFEVIT